MKVIKRDGRVVPFDQNKIIDAILAAFQQVDGELTDYAYIKAGNIADYILDFCKDYKRKQYELNKDEAVHPSFYLTVEEIQDLVEKGLMSTKRKDVAKEYLLYRENRSRERNKRSLLTKEIGEKLMASNIQNQNANVDELSFGGRRGEAANAIMKDYALNYIMSPKAKENHIENMIYTHDLDSYAVGMHNCLSVPFDDLLAKGFNTRQTPVRAANSINTAFQLVAVIFQLQSLQQFGGVSATHLDWTMVPYIRKSFYKHWKDGLKWIEENSSDTVTAHRQPFKEELSIEDDYYKKWMKAYLYAKEMTIKECQQAVEGMYHNLNTLQSRSGNQLPFTSINYGTCTLPEGRMVIKALLEGSIKGVGPHHITPIFPCGIFQCMKGVNRKPGDPNYDLFQLALKSTSQRLYPNYANVDWSGNAGYDISDPKTYFSTMGLA